MPIDLPLWMLGVSVAFAVLIGKEAFGGTGMNILNPALVARAFAYFSYAPSMSGDKVWVADASTVDALSGETILGALATGGSTSSYSAMDMFWGLIPGSVGETSVLMILIGAALLLFTGVGSWRIMLSSLLGGAAMGLIFNWAGTYFPENALLNFPWWQHLMVGGFAFVVVFMATDPVSAAQTHKGKWIYGFLLGFIGMMIRIINPAYPEGIMLSILLLNVFALTIDHYVIQANVNKRKNRLKRLKMNKNSNLYTFVFAIIMVAIIAGILAFTAESLKATQQTNVKAEKMQNILSTIGVTDVSREDAETVFKKYIKQEISLNKEGQVDQDVVAFDINLKNEIKKGDSDQRFPLYVAEKDGKTFYVVPLYGAGLWDAIWGYVALDSDKNTIVGANFDHQGETPGLGAEITTDWFQTQFKGKTILENDKFVSVKTIKGGAPTGDMHGVDAISRRNNYF